MSEIFAKRLKTERELLGWTQQYMAGLLGITNGTLSGYERNYREPDIETLTKISELLKVSVDYLIGKTEIRTPKESGDNDLEGLMYLRLSKSNLPESAKKQFIKAFKENLKLIEELENEEENKETTT